MANTTVKTPSEWRSDLWGAYAPGVNDFMSVIQKSIDSGDIATAQLAEAGRNSYVSNPTYTGTQRTTNIVGNYIASQATQIGQAASNVVEKITEPVKAAAEKVSEPAAEKEQPTQIIYSAFDPAAYADQQISGGVSDQTASNIIGIGIIAVIGFVILDKLIG